MKKALGEREENARSETCASRGTRLKKKIRSQVSRPVRFHPLAFET